jgi:hypothetical protein
LQQRQRRQTIGLPPLKRNVSLTMSAKPPFRDDCDDIDDISDKIHSEIEECEEICESFPLPQLWFLRNLQFF